MFAVRKTAAALAAAILVTLFGLPATEATAQIKVPAGGPDAELHQMQTFHFSCSNLAAFDKSLLGNNYLWRDVNLGTSIVYFQGVNCICGKSADEAKQKFREAAAGKTFDGRHEVSVEVETGEKVETTIYCYSTSQLAELNKPGDGQRDPDRPRAQQDPSSKTDDGEQERQN